MFIKYLIKPSFFILLVLHSAIGYAQEASAVAADKTVLWEEADISSLDLFAGPGGTAMKPDLKSIKFIEEEKSGHNKKYRIEDASGRIWVAKLGSEAQPETAAVRLLWGLGYKTEINYLVPSLTIPGKGTFENVRLEARPAGTKRLDEWKWRDNPFVGTNELQGLKIMMVFLTNWDLLDLQNKVLRVEGQNGPEDHYVISDLGATVGKLGNNNLPVIFRIGRKTGDPDAWTNARFVERVKNGELEFHFKGKGRDMMKGITVEQGRWLYEKLAQLSDAQVSDAFRAANYSPADTDLLVAAFRRRVEELNKAVGPAATEKAKN